MRLRHFLVLLCVALASGLGLAAPRDVEQRRIAWQYDDLTRCKALFALASNAKDRRSQRAAANIDTKLKQLAHGKSEEQVLNDIALKTAKWYGGSTFADPGWRHCQSTYAPYGIATDFTFTQKLYPHTPPSDKLAAAKAVLAAPEQYSSLLLIMAGEPLFRAGQQDDGRFLYHAGVLRASHLGHFLEIHADQDMIQVLNWTRRGFGIPFLIDEVLSAHDARVAVEHAIAWDRGARNSEIEDALDDAADKVAVERQIEADRCNYVASHYFNEAAAMLEVKERYDGDVDKYRAAVTADISRLSTAGAASQRDGAVSLFSARQKRLADDAKNAVAKASFGGDKSAFEAASKNDPAATCGLLLTEAKRLVQ